MFGFGVKEINVLELHERLVQEPGAISLVDVRSPEEVAQGALPGALHIPLHLLPIKAHEIPEQGTVVIYCRSGARSAQACAFLSSNGRRNVVNLRGGILAWVQNGLGIA